MRLIPDNDLIAQQSLNRLKDQIRGQVLKEEPSVGFSVIVNLMAEMMVMMDLDDDEAVTVLASVVRTTMALRNDLMDHDRSPTV